ncbi:hypothetical protein ACWDVV_30775, partial [Streptomyces tendae]
MDAVRLHRVLNTTGAGRVFPASHGTSADVLPRAVDSLPSWDCNVFKRLQGVLGAADQSVGELSALLRAHADDLLQQVLAEAAASQVVELGTEVLHPLDGALSEVVRSAYRALDIIATAKNGDLQQGYDAEDQALADLI